MIKARVILTFCTVLVLPTAGNAAESGDLVPIEELGLRIAPGFGVSVFSDSDLANDIQAMTLNSKGEPVVTGRGYIKTLRDADGDGKADGAVLFAQPAGGGMGLCFDGDYLLYVGDGALWRYRDADGDGRADGPPERLISTTSGEHGGHAIRKGPDGSWYLIGGNDSGLTRQFGGSVQSRFPGAEAGAIVRLAPDLKSGEVVADGFRNPYDFDFNASGDMFTYDSDGEREYLLPWYAPTRIFQVQHGAHHGWRLEGYLRSWASADYYPDVATILAPIGRGSPTGVVCYRHTRFPGRYRNGLFALEWTFGRVWFLPLRADGAGYRGEPEVFLEPLGTHGFAPTDVCVAPDGALLVSIGGRKTRGAVFRIDVANAAPLRRDRSKPEKPDPILDDERAALTFVLTRPQPLDAWSRAEWEPVARRLGDVPFRQAAVDERLPQASRVRAIEIVTELFDGLETARAMVGGEDRSASIRARVAWSLGVKAGDDAIAILPRLAGDPHSLVRRNALEALKARLHQVNPADLSPALLQNLSYRDKQVRHAAVQVASRIPDPAWEELRPLALKSGLQGELSALLVDLWRRGTPRADLETLVAATRVLERSHNTELRLQALRVGFLALGDFNIHKPSVEVYAQFETVHDVSGAPELRQRLSEAVRADFPTGVPRLDRESARMLAVLRDPAPESARLVASLLTDISPPADDVHHMTALSRLPGVRDIAATSVLARRITGLDAKLGGQHLRTKQNWTVRLAETVRALCELDPRLADELIRQPSFASPGMVEIALGWDAKSRAEAAMTFKKAVEADRDFPWTPALVRLLGTLPTDDIRPLFEKQWVNFGLRDEIVLRLARDPRPEDEPRFVIGTGSQRHEVVQASLTALLAMPRRERPEQTAALVRLLKRLVQEPKQRELRDKAIALLNRDADQQFRPDESASRLLDQAYEPVFQWAREKHPETMAGSGGTTAGSALEWDRLVQSVSWATGDIARGAELFRHRACESCHGGGATFGPDLNGATGRFSPRDLMDAIAFPSRDVAPAYRATVVTLKNGESHSGVVTFESADGLILQTGPASVVRLAENEIAERKTSDTSLMPTGLVEGLGSSDLADLFAYLKNLGAGAENRGCWNGSQSETMIGGGFFL